MTVSTISKKSCFFGGEPSLYVEQAELFLQKLKEHKMLLNYVSTNTNGTLRSEAFAKVFIDFADYSTFSSEAVFIISWDRWHEQSLMERFPEVDIEENFEWYRQRIYTKNVEIEDEPDIELISEGRAKELLKDTKNHMINVGVPNHGKLNFNDLKYLYKICAGPDNLCGHGCVYNCISSTLYLTAKGDVLLGHNVSYDHQDQGYYRICNILEQSIFDGLLDLRIAEAEYDITINPIERLAMKSDIAAEATNLLEPKNFVGKITDELFAASEERRFLEHFESEESISYLESEAARRELVWQFCTLRKFKNPET